MFRKIKEKIAKKKIEKLQKHGKNDKKSAKIASGVASSMKKDISTDKNKLGKYSKLTISLRLGITILILGLTVSSGALLTTVFYKASELVALQFGNKNVIELQGHTKKVVNDYFRDAEKNLLDNHKTLIRFLKTQNEGKSAGQKHNPDIVIQNQLRYSSVGKSQSDRRILDDFPTPLGKSEVVNDLVGVFLESSRNISAVYIGFENSGNLFMAKKMSDGTLSFRQVIQQGDETTTYWEHENPRYYYDFPSQVTTSANDGYDPRKRNWYKDSINAQIVEGHQQSIWSEPYFFASDKKIGMTISKKIELDGLPVGVFAVDLPLDRISEFLSDFDVVKNQNGLIFLASPKEILLATSGRGVEENNARSRLFKEVTRKDAEFSVLSSIKIYESLEPLIRGVILTKKDFFNYSDFFRGKIQEKDMQKLLFAFYEVYPSDYLENVSARLFDQIAADVVENFKLTAEVERETFFTKTQMSSKYGIFEFEKELFLSTATTIYPSKWFPVSMGMAIPYKVINGPLQTTLELVLVASILVMTFSVLIAIVIARKISTPLVEISRDMNRIRNFQLDDDEDTSKEQQSFTELQDIRISFDNMKRGLVSFKKFVPSEIVSQLIRQGIEADVSGKKENITTLFSDITQFTRLTEKTKSDDLIEQLHQYFNVVSRTIDFHKGTLDKYIGDSVMAIWGAPVAMENHAIRACYAALNCNEVISEMNENFTRVGMERLETRIGLNSGEAIVGNIGSDARLNYTAIGDSVNLASRLENVNKLYGTRIIISENTYQLAKDFIETRPIDKIAVYGKEAIIPIYELVSKKGEATVQQKKLIAMSSEAFSYIDNLKWSAAIRTLRAIKSMFPEDIVCEILIDRCYRYIENKELRGVEFAYTASDK